MGAEGDLDDTPMAIVTLYDPLYSARPTRDISPTLTCAVSSSLRDIPSATRKAVYIKN